MNKTKKSVKKQKKENTKLEKPKKFASSGIVRYNSYIMENEYALVRGDFKEHIENELFYVDNTLMIRDFLKMKDSVTLITKPRRFGKSLNLSMLKYFFDMKEKEGSEKLFKPFNIWKDEESKQHMNKYPVIHLSFANLQKDNIKSVLTKVGQMMSKLYCKNVEVKEILSDKEKKDFELIVNETYNPDILDSSLGNLICYMNRYHKKKVIVLIDEYDAPVNDMYTLPDFDKCLKFFSSFYRYSFKNVEKIEVRSLLTGILRVAKDNVFSALNHLRVVSVMSEEYSQYFGFREEVIKPVIEAEGLTMKEAKEWYNGYTFGKNIVYNPWSMVNYLFYKIPKPYWKNTSSNKLIHKLVKEGGPEIKDTLEKMLKGKAIKLNIEDEVDLREIGIDEIWSIFLQSGYLTYEERKGIKYFKLPNKEVKDFMKKLVNGINEKFKIDYKILEAVKEKNWIDFESRLTKWIDKAISCYDVPKRDSNRAEIFYHAMLMGMFAPLNEEYEIVSNIESGQGRPDIILKRKSGKETIIIELKSKKEKVKVAEDMKVKEIKEIEEYIKGELEDTLQKGKAQMKSRKYASGQTAGKITQLAIAFIGKNIKMGIVD